MAGEKDKKQDLRLELADRLIAQIEQGTAHWQRPWEAGELQLPINAVTGKPYRGVNQEFLIMLSPDLSDPRWMTLKQANAQGWSIKEGEHGVPIEKWSEYEHKLTAEEKQKLLEDGLEPKDKEKRLGVKYYKVFHASQIDGIPPIERPERTFETQGTLDDRLPRLAEAMGISVEHIGTRAFYRKSEDLVRMPPAETFEKAASHDTVFLHELSHATGHESRLGRDLTGTFGTEKYALEELRAEMSAAMTAASLGIGFDPASQSLEEGREENSAAYLASWLRKLPEKERKQAILGAVKDAQGISDYLLDRTPERDRHNLNLDVAEARELPDFAPIEQNGITVSQNKGKAGLEVKFTEKPEQEVLEGLKAGGFRWSRKEGLWYSRDTEKSRETLVNALHVDDKALGLSAEILDPGLVDYLKQQVSMEDDQKRVAMAQDHAQQDPDKASAWAVLLRDDPHGYAQAVGRDDVEADTMRGAATLLEESVKREQQKILDKEDRKAQEYWESVKYVVQNEHTLGYVLPEQENAPAMLGVLQGDVLNGGPDRMQGMVLLEQEHLRRATEQDFERFRVQLPPDFQREPEIAKDNAREQAIQQFVKHFENLPDAIDQFMDDGHRRFDDLPVGSAKVYEAGFVQLQDRMSKELNAVHGIVEDGPDKGAYKPILDLQKAGLSKDEMDALMEKTESQQIKDRMDKRTQAFAARLETEYDHNLSLMQRAEQQAIEAPALQRGGLREVPDTVLPFLGGDQLAVTREGLRGEEKAFFSDKMRELETIIQQMPETYGTDGKPDHEKPVSLRYFGPGNSQWFIIEKDRGDPANNDRDQTQVFGLADLGQGEPELGYISIPEITRHGAELDYHFERTNLLEVKKQHYPEMVRNVSMGDSLKEPLDAELVEHLKTRADIRLGEMSVSSALGGTSLSNESEWPGGLPTGLGGDPVQNAEAFTRTMAMREPEKAVAWAGELLKYSDRYSDAVPAFAPEHLVSTAKEMARSAGRSLNPVVGDLVRAEPVDPSRLREPFSGRVIAKMDTTSGDCRYHLRAEVGPNGGPEGMQATVYGKDYRFSTISKEQAYGFERDNPNKAVEQKNDIDPREQAVIDYNRFHQTLPERVGGLIEHTHERFTVIDPTSSDAYAKAMHDTMAESDKVFGIITQGEDRGAFAPQVALSRAGVETARQQELRAIWREVSQEQAVRYREGVEGAKNAHKARMQERGKAMLRQSDLSPEQTVMACFFKHGIMVDEKSGSVQKMLQAVENKDLKTLTPWIGNNSQNPASTEAFSRLTGVTLGKTQKERVQQLQAWAGPEKVRALQQEMVEKDRAKAAEAPRKALRVAFDALADARVQVHIDGASKVLNGQEYVEYKVAQGYTQVAARKKGAVTERVLRNPKTHEISSFNNQGFRNFCKAVDVLEPGGDIAAAMESARIPLDVVPGRGGQEKNMTDLPKIGLKQNTVVLTHRKDLKPRTVQEPLDADKPLLETTYHPRQEISGVLTDIGKRELYMQTPDLGSVAVDCNGTALFQDRDEELLAAKGKNVTVSIDDTGRQLSMAVQQGQGMSVIHDQPKLRDAVPFGLVPAENMMSVGAEPVTGKLTHVHDSNIIELRGEHGPLLVYGREPSREHQAEIKAMLGKQVTVKGDEKGVLQVSGPREHRVEKPGTTPRLVAGLNIGQERYAVTVDETGKGKLSVVRGDKKQVMPLTFHMDKYRNHNEQKERNCLRASASFDDGVVRDVTLYPDLGHKNVLAIFAEQNPGQKRQPIAAAELLKPNQAATEQGLPQGAVAYLKKTLGVDMNATQKEQKVNKGTEIM